MRSTITPKMKVNLVKGALKGMKLNNMKTHTTERNRETKHSIRQRENLKVFSNTTNGGLKKETHRDRGELQFATPKRGNKEESTTRHRRRNRTAKLTLDYILNAHPWVKVQALEVQRH